MFDLTGKTALVTGASGGIGGAIARALHAQGATVALSGTRREALEALAGELGARVHVTPCDLSDQDAVEALVPAAEAAMGSLDILVNNAGVTRDNLFARMKDAEWDTVIAVDLTAGFRLARASLKGMMRRRWGRIIGITSIVGVTGNPGQGNYAAAKAGMIGMSKALAGEIASRAITVNCIAPGFIASPMTDALNEKQRETHPGGGSHAPARSGRGYRRRGGLSRERRGGLRHRANSARQWRNGNDLRRLPRSSDASNASPRPLALTGEICYRAVSSPKRLSCRRGNPHGIVFEARSAGVRRRSRGTVRNGSIDWRSILGINHRRAFAPGRIREKANERCRGAGKEDCRRASRR